MCSHHSQLKLANVRLQENVQKCTAELEADLSSASAHVKCTDRSSLHFVYAYMQHTASLWMQ
eukprot:351893-Chlamydomonas_euryale.AAC.33